MRPVARQSRPPLRLPSRTGIGGNGGPPINDPLTMEHVFPRLDGSPAGSILTMTDTVFDLTGPAQVLTIDLTAAHTRQLIGQIRAIDPNYRFDSLGTPTTIEGQANQIRGLRLDRAEAYYRVKGDLRPLQVETLRLLQDRADTAYDEGKTLHTAGRLKVRLSREEAIGNYVDRATRRHLREFNTKLGISTAKGGAVRVIGREYATSGSDRTYRIPDARVGNLAFDVSLTQKTLRTPQIRGFFNSDFKPGAVIIVRPTQLGSGGTYIIIRPKGLP